MHNDRFSTIDEILDHYSDGVQNVSTTSDLVYKKEGKASIPLSQSEKAAFTAFIHSLTDHDFIHEKAWSVSY